MCIFIIIRNLVNKRKQQQTERHCSNKLPTIITRCQNRGVMKTLERHHKIILKMGYKTKKQKEWKKTVLIALNYCPQGKMDTGRLQKYRISKWHFNRYCSGHYIKSVRPSMIKTWVVTWNKDAFKVYSLYLTVTVVAPGLMQCMGEHLKTDLYFQQYWLQVSTHFQQLHVCCMLLDLFTLIWTKLYQKIK